jgi:hypothetical protein
MLSALPTPLQSKQFTHDAHTAVPKPHRSGSAAIRFNSFDFKPVQRGPGDFWRDLPRIRSLGVAFERLPLHRRTTHQE